MTVAPASMLCIELSPVEARPSGALSRLDSGADLVARPLDGPHDTLARQISEISPEVLQQGLVAVAQAVAGAMERIAPDTASVEFSMGFKAGAKVPVLMSGEANAALKVTLTWKKSAPAASEARS